MWDYSSFFVGRRLRAGAAGKVLRSAPFPFPGGNSTGIRSHRGFMGMVKLQPRGGRGVYGPDPTECRTARLFKTRRGEMKPEMEGKKMEKPNFS